MNQSLHVPPSADSNGGAERPAQVDGPVAAGHGFVVWDAENAAEHAAWTRLWNASPTREVFAHPNYVRLFCRPGDRVLCAAWEGNEGAVLFPFRLRDLRTEPYWEAESGAACDLIGPYGYGGAVRWGSAAPDVLARGFWRAFDAWAATQGLVSEFVRFTPFAEELLPYPGVVCENRKVILRDLRTPPHLMWREFAHNVRYNIRKARRAGVQVKSDAHGDTLAEFLRIYDHTMRRRGANPLFTFPPQFFQRLQQDLPGQFVYFHAVCGNRVVASELVLLSAHAAYSFLGGTDSEAFKLSPNHLLKQEIIHAAAAMGKQWFVLGGGFEPHDGIFQYKRGFAPHGVTAFHVGWKIHDEQRCNRLIEARRRYGQHSGQDWLPRLNFFPPYRA